MSYSNSSSNSGMYSTLPAMGLPCSTVLLSRPYKQCRCDSCTIEVLQTIESAIYEPVEPLMIPTLSSGFAWWNVRLPSKLAEPAVPSNSAEYITIDEDVMSFLEEKKVFNWCPGLRQLHPIRTTGDGNCLMHAVILATCGIQDSGIVLRRLVYVALVESVSNTFRKRWQQEKQRLNESIPGGLQYTTEEWDKEWNMVVNAAEDQRKTTMAYEFLEEMHVFVLANVICRPIIILGESTVRSPLAGDSIEQNNFVGIYLPLLWDSKHCCKNPVVLCFLHNHFQPLISRYTFPSEPKDLLAVPLVTSRLEPLHIHFLLPVEESMAHDLLQQYLYTSEVPRKSEDGSSDEAILVAEIVYSQLYCDWEISDYIYLTDKVHARGHVQKIAQVPSKSSLNYIQSAKEALAHKTLHDLYQPKHVAGACCHSRNKHQKSLMMAQMESSMSMLGNSSGNKHSSSPKDHTDCTKIHEDHSTGHLDSTGWNKHLHLNQSMNLSGVGQDRHHVATEAESIPDNVMIFKTLKKLKSPQQTEGATWSGSNAVEDRMSCGHSEKEGQHGDVGGECGYGNTGNKSKVEMQLTPSGSKMRTVAPRTPVLQSIRPGNSKRSTAESQNQPQRKLSDISDADVEYIQQKFTKKTPIYCRSLALLGKQCAKPDCSRFLVDETDFCCSIHAYPPTPPLEVVEKLRTLCIRSGCLNFGLPYYNGKCARCVIVSALENDLRKEQKRFLSPQTGYGRSYSCRGTKSASTHSEPPEASVGVIEPKFKCITDGCNESVFEVPSTKLVGMCIKCFVQEYMKVNFPTPKKSELPEIMKAERTVKPLKQVKCVTDGYKSLGYSDNSDWCSECYPPSFFSKEKAETKRAVDAKCKTKDCYSFGYSYFFGWCPKCYIQADCGIREGSGMEHKENPDTVTLVESAKTETPRSRSESGMQKERSQGNTQPPKSVATEEVEVGKIHWVHEKSEKTYSRAVEDDFDDWYDRKYPAKVLGEGTFSPDPPISGILPFRKKSAAQDREEFEMKARNDCTKNNESVRDKQFAILKDDGESSSPKNALERSTSEGNAEAYKEDPSDDLPPLMTVESSRRNNGSENYGKLSSDDLVPVDAPWLCLPKSDNGVWTLPSSDPGLVASGDECSDGEEFFKCLSASCEHDVTDTVAGGYCDHCHATCSLGHMDAQVSKVAEGISDQLVKMPTQETVVPCVTEGCCSTAAIVEFGLCSACYAFQLETSTTQANCALQSSRQNPVSSTNRRSVTKADETSKSPWTCSGLPRMATPCLRPSCDRYGDPVYHGYCSQCATQFENSTMEIDSC